LHFLHVKVPTVVSLVLHPFTGHFLDLSALTTSYASGLQSVAWWMSNY